MSVRSISVFTKPLGKTTRISIVALATRRSVNPLLVLPWIRYSSWRL